MMTQPWLTFKSLLKLTQAIILQYAVLDYVMCDFNKMVLLLHSYSFCSNDVFIVAAQKALLKANELKPQDLLTLTTLGDVERKLCLLPDSLSRFKCAISISNSSEVVAFLGIASTCLAAAYSRFSLGWTEGAAEMVLSGIEFADSALALLAKMGNASQKYISVYKVKGDLCSFAVHLR